MTGFVNNPSGRALAVIARMAEDAERDGIDLDWTATHAVFELGDALEIAEKVQVEVCDETFRLIRSTMQARGRQQRR